MCEVTVWDHRGYTLKIRWLCLHLPITFHKAFYKREIGERGIRPIAVTVHQNEMAVIIVIVENVT